MLQDATLRMIGIKDNDLCEKISKIKTLKIR